jgi:hypothetical protein
MKSSHERKYEFSCEHLATAERHSAQLQRLAFVRIAPNDGLFKNVFGRRTTCGMAEAHVGLISRGKAYGAIFLLVRHFQ